MTGSESMEHVEVLRRMANESWVGSPEHTALAAAIASLSAQQPPAEAQPVGDVLPRMKQLRRFVAREREHNPDKTHIAEWALREIERLCEDCAHNPGLCDEHDNGGVPLDGQSAPVGAAEEMVLDAIERRAPSAPVGVEALVGNWAARAETKRAESKNKEWAEWLRENHAGAASTFATCARELSAALAQQSAACAHSWNDYGTVNRAWCSRCNAVAVIGHEDRPYGVLSVTDDGEYRTNPIQQPATVDELIGALHEIRSLQAFAMTDDRGMRGDNADELDAIIAAALAAQQGGEP